MDSKDKKVLIIFFGIILVVIALFCLVKFTPVLDFFNPNRTVITKNDTQVVEKSSLATSIDKIKDAVMVVESYRAGQKVSTGTGFVYKTDNKYGYVLTNQHVIANADNVQLLLSNDNKVDGVLLGSDEYLDLAVIRIDKKNVLAVAELSSSEDTKIGDQVFTIGSPLGEEYRGSVTSGILSGKDRLVSVKVSNSSTEDWVMKVLQTDAAVNPGNSGGPLVNINGEVIGVISMKLADEEIEGMGFAIPIESAKSHLEALEAKQEIEWPVLGITMANVNDAVALYRYQIDIDKSVDYGVVITGISENTGAAKADLKERDIIIAIDGEKVKNTAYLRYELYKHKVGDTISVTYIRDNKERTTKVTLSK